jgi:hypothetical protein
MRRASFWFMTDAQTFIKPKGNNLQEIVEDLHRISKENKFGMICPVIILGKNEKELKRVGKHCHVDGKGNVDTTKWLSEIKKIKCVLEYKNE